MSQRLDQIFADRLNGWRDRAAIMAGGRCLTYRDLDLQSNRLARCLIEMGVARGNIVAVAVGDIEGLAIAALAVLKAGATYLAIDTRYSVERVRDVLNDAAPAILLADARFPEEFIPETLPILRNFASASVLDSHSDQPLNVPGSADDAAFVCYTSGSTGRPKGIEIAHRGVPHLVGDADFLPFGSDDRVGQAANFAFDAITFELWGALLNGGCIVHIPHEVLFSAPALMEFLKAQGITILWLTTSLFNALASSRPEAFESLKVLVIGGEAADPVPIGKVFQTGRAPRRLLNGYGPTETTTFSTWHEVTMSDVANGIIPIGVPIQKTKTCILDEAMRPLPAGEAGELFIGGPGVALGYLKQPGLTRERFVPSPFAGTPGDRLYRTGDLCRLLPDGKIQYLDRTDDQVKIRGFRIEPREVASAIGRLPGVEEAVVLARDVAFGTRELVAFVRGSVESVETLRQKLSGILPGYMIPSIIRKVDTFPLNANGKLDRKALLARIELTEDPSPNSGDTDDVTARITAIWKRVLRREDLPPDRDFRELGGDSLSAMNLALEVEKAFGIVLSVDQLASPLTISGLSGRVRQQLGQIQAGQGAAAKNAASSHVFAIAYPWMMGQMPEEIGRALSPHMPWRHAQLPFTYFNSGRKITIEEMAVEVERLISTMAPQGPYRLYGHCFTGLLAYEVAQRLMAAGHTVEMLVIADSFPKFAPTPLRSTLSFGWRLLRFVRSGCKFRRGADRTRAAAGAAPGSDQRMRDACFFASGRYRPEPYGGRLIVFRPSRFAKVDPFLGNDLNAWRRLAPDCVEYTVNFHQEDCVTATSVDSGFKEAADALKSLTA